MDASSCSGSGSSSSSSDKPRRRKVSRHCFQQSESAQMGLVP
jgi:hypothetical protein